MSAADAADLDSESGSDGASMPALERLYAALALLVFPVATGLGLALVALVFVHPFIVGPLLGGGVLGGAVLYARSRLGLGRRGGLVLVAGTVALTWLVWHWGDYHRFRSDTRDRAKVHYGAGRTVVETDAAVDAVLREETGSAGFLGFLRMRLGRGLATPMGLLRGPVLGLLWLLDLLALVVGARWRTGPFIESPA